MQWKNNLFQLPQSIPELIFPSGYTVKFNRKFNGRIARACRHSYHRAAIVHTVCWCVYATHFSHGDRKIRHSRESAYGATTIVFCLTQPRRFSALEISLIGRDKIVVVAIRSSSGILINGTLRSRGNGTPQGKKTVEIQVQNHDGNRNSAPITADVAPVTYTVLCAPLRREAPDVMLCLRHFGINAINIGGALIMLSFPCPRTDVRINAGAKSRFRKP